MTDRERLEADAVRVLVEHQRKDAGSCVCGWSQWGASHSEHVWRMLRLIGVTVRGEAA